MVYDIDGKTYDVHGCLRPVICKLWDGKAYGKTAAGAFHKWSTEDFDGEQCVVAVVEFEGGGVGIVRADRVTFVDPYVVKKEIPS